MFGHRRTLIAVVLVCLIGLITAYNRPTSAGPASGSALAGSTTRAAAADRLDLGTFNIDGGEGIDGNVDLDRTAHCLQKLDLIGLQEVHGFGDGAQNQAALLGGRLQLRWLYVPAERQAGHDSFGNAFFADLPVVRWQRVVLPSTFLHAKRNYLLADLDWGGRSLHMITTHVDFKGNGDEQLALVVAAFLAQPTPAILMGDLNHPASSKQIQQLSATPGVQECVGRVLEPVPGRVDWIFVRGLQTVDAGSVDLKASDHPAYWAQVRRTATNPPASAAARRE